MKTEKNFNGLRWALFVPLQLILSGIFVVITQWIPIFWIVNKLFDLGDANPLKTKIVSGPIGFLLVYVLYGIALIASSVISINITSKPKLAWKILWVLQLLHLLLLLLIYEITGKNHFTGNIWFNCAQASAMVTAAIISRFMLDDEN